MPALNSSPKNPADRRRLPSRLKASRRRRQPRFGSVSVFGLLAATLTPQWVLAAQEQTPTLGEAPRAERPAFASSAPSGSLLKPDMAAAGSWLDTSNRSAVLTAYQSTFAPAVPASGWTGNIASCTAGTLSDAHRANAFSRVNWYTGHGRPA